MNRRRTDDDPWGDRAADTLHQSTDDGFGAPSADDRFAFGKSLTEPVDSGVEGGAVDAQSIRQMLERRQEMLQQQQQQIQQQQQQQQRPAQQQFTATQKICFATGSAFIAGSAADAVVYVASRNRVMIRGTPMALGFARFALGLAVLETGVKYLFGGHK